MRHVMLPAGRGDARVDRRAKLRSASRLSSVQPPRTPTSRRRGPAVRAGCPAWRLLVATVLALLLATATLLPQRTPVAQAATLGYASAFVGSAAPDSASGFGIAVDGGGHAYLAGQFAGTVDFDPGAGTATTSSLFGSQDGYATRLDMHGAFVDTPIRSAGLGNDELRGIAIDGVGNEYVTGTFNDTGDTANNQATAVKLDTNHNAVWAGAFSGTGHAQGRGIGVDGAGNVYLTGFFSGTVDFDPSLGGTFNLTSTSAGLSDVFVVKLDNGGNLIWAKQLGGTDSDIGNGVAVDGAGNVYVTGLFSGTADFDPSPGGTALLTSLGLSDAFAVKLDTNGTFVWVQRIGLLGTDVGTGIAVDAAGSVYVTGQVSTAGAGDVFAVKLDPTGAPVWAQQMGGPGDDSGNAIAVDGDGNVYLTGSFSGTVDFDPGPGTTTLQSAGGHDAFAVKLDATGALVWAHRFGGPTDDFGNGIAVSGLSNVYLTGSFTGTVDFDPGPGTTNLTSNAGSPANNAAFVVNLVQKAPPTNGLPIAPQATADDTPLVFSTANGNRISVADPDNGSTPLGVSLSVTSGTLTLATTAGLTFSGGDGTADATMSFAGTLTAINTALNGLTFAPVLGGPSGVTFQISTVDRVPLGQAVTDSLAIGITRRPVAVNDAYAVNTGASLSVGAGAGVLANDTDADTSAAALRAEVVSGPTRGTLSLQPDGSFTYAPRGGDGGTDSFTYRVVDPQGNAATGTATMTITAVACGPRPTVTVTTAVVNGALQATISATQTGAPTQNVLRSLSFGTLDAAANAQVTLNGNAVASGQTVTLAANTTTQTFTVRRITAGHATTVKLTVTDVCGTWPTFVGGGTGAGF